MINLSEDRILDFLDGRLASPDQEELLHTLSVSPERRQVLREHMKLREVTNTIARQDRFAVPEYVTEDLFVKLEGLGYSAPISTEALLSRTPEYVSVAATAAVATAVSSGWRIGAMSLLTASIMSFILGAGAYYVFGSSLGLRTRSQELADMKRHAVTKHMASLPIAVSQFDMAAAEPVSNNISNISGNGTKNATHSAMNTGSTPVEAGLIGPVSTGDQIASSSIPNASDNSNAGIIGDIPLSYTGPVKSSYAASVTAPQPLTDVMPFWPSAVPSPLAEERGTIGVQYGSGPAWGSTSVQWNDLREFKFGFAFSEYFVGAASLGWMHTYERTVEGELAPNVKSGQLNYVINTPLSNSSSSTMLMGLEGGITLDRLGAPITAMVGFMYSGVGTGSGGSPKEYSTFYERGSLMVHFEPLNKMIVSAGIEGLFYTHYLQTSTQENSEYPGSPYKAVLAPNAVTSEVCGLIGPSLQIGWHF